MITLPELTLNRTDIDLQLREFERKYGISSLDFRTQPDLRARVSGEDDFEWDVLLEHLDALNAAQEEAEQAMHRAYLRQLTRGNANNEDSSSYLAQVAA